MIEIKNKIENINNKSVVKGKIYLINKIIMEIINKIKEKRLQNSKLYYEECLDRQFSFKLHKGKLYIFREDKPIILLSDKDTVSSIIEKVESLKTLDRTYHNII